MTLTTERKDQLFNETSQDNNIFNYHQRQKEAEDDFALYRREKMASILEREEAKKEDLKLIKTFDPWGRQGYGPKKDSPRKQKFTEEQLSFKNNNTNKNNNNNNNSSNDSNDYNISIKKPADEIGINEDFYKNFGKPGAGAPLLQPNGRDIRTELTADVSIRFQDGKVGKKMNEIELRYRDGDGDKKMELRRDLENQIAQKALKEQERRLADLASFYPFGKAGGGAPKDNNNNNNKNKNNDNNKLVISPRSLSNNQQAGGKTPNGKELDDDTPRFDPWGKGVGNPSYDEYGDAKRLTNINFGSTESTFKVKKQDDSKEIDRKRNDNGTSLQTVADLKRFDVQAPIYDPWGKGGAGAPIRDESGNIVTQIFGKIKKEKPSGHPAELPSLQSTSADSRNIQNAKLEYLEELQREIHQHKVNKLTKPFEESDDLASVIRRGQVGHPKRDPKTGLLLEQHLNATDVTSEKVKNANYIIGNNTNTHHQQQQQGQMSTAAMDSLKYHTELEALAEERKRSKIMEREMDKLESQKHGENFDNSWGKPGGGAPNLNQKKNDIHTVLYHPRKEHENYRKRMDLVNGGAPQQNENNNNFNYVRSTVPSTHTNQYDFPYAQRREAKRDYKLMSPYATN